MNNEAILAFLKRLDLETALHTSYSLTNENRVLILQKGIRALIDALDTIVKTKENP
jgi:hypothetical protein